MGREARYFENPEQAVAAISELLVAERFAELSRYYDLSDSSVDRGALAEGRYLVRDSPPDAHHPGVPWRFVQPFAPGFTYSSHEPLGKAGLHRVTVERRIETGADLPDQVGVQEFLMRHSEDGWQLILDESLS